MNLLCLAFCGKMRISSFLKHDRSVTLTWFVGFVGGGGDEGRKIFVGKGKGFFVINLKCHSRILRLSSHKWTRRIHTTLTFIT